MTTAIIYECVRGHITIVSHVMGETVKITTLCQHTREDGEACKETAYYTPPEFIIEKGGDLNGTSLQGYITANYKDIVALLGKPSDADGYKVDAEWVCTINGKVLTLYNYKDGKNYNGARGIPKTKITDWRVGGHGNVTAEAKFLASKLNSTYRG